MCIYILPDGAVPFNKHEHGMVMFQRKRTIGFVQWQLHGTQYEWGKKAEQRGEEAQRRNGYSCDRKG